VTGARAAGALLLALLVLAGLLAGCRAAAPAPPTAVTRELSAPLEPVRAVYVEKTAALLPYWAAVDGGYFARNGLAVELLQVSDQQEMLQRAMGGRAEVLLAPLTTELMARAADGSDVVILGGTPELAVITLRPLLASRELIFERFLRGLLEGIHAVQTRPDAMRELLARQGMGVAAEGALGAYAERVPYLAPSDVEPLIAARAAEDPRAARLDPGRLVDPTLLRRLEASGFVAALYRA
jgi:ABC-type nitrate/sulfonate/bicarbonate transport system substrate-binding protein